MNWLSSGRSDIENDFLKSFRKPTNVRRLPSVEVQATGEVEKTFSTYRHRAADADVGPLRGLNAKQTLILAFRRFERHTDAGLIAMHDHARFVRKRRHLVRTAKAVDDPG